MKWTVLAIAIIMLLCTAAIGQMGSYSTSTSGGAPTPTTPTSPESLGLEAPSSPTTSAQSPSVQERSQGLISSNQQAAYASAPQGLKATANSPTYNQVIYPPGSNSQNGLYISYAPQTVASCSLYANLPLWLKTSGSGNIWFYEWYPNGMLDTQYAGNVYYPGWYKRWFFADVPGWHILQYYCNGWSNYAYIYVYGPSGYWVNPNPSPSPSPYPYPYPYSDSQTTYTYTYPSTGHTYNNPYG